MAIVNSRQSLKDYCLRRLGFPVIDINVDDDQVDDRIDDALEFYHDYHYDATSKFFISHRVSATDIANKYIDLSQMSGTGTANAGSNTLIGDIASYFPTEAYVGQQIKVDNETVTITGISNNQFMTVTPAFSVSHNSAPVINLSDANSIMGVTKLFPIGSTSATVNMFDLRYQLRLHELYDFTSTSYVNYVLTMQHLRTLEMMFTGDVTIRFNRHQNRLYIDTSWGNIIQPGEYIMAETYKIINPDQFPMVYNDRYLKEYATALIKMQWGANLSKFGGVALLGGVTLNGEQIYSQAIAEKKDLETKMMDMYELPAEFLIG